MMPAVYHVTWYQFRGLAGVWRSREFGNHNAAYRFARTVNGSVHSSHDGF